MQALKSDPLGAPFSAGTGRASVNVPAGACDCHVHVYDSRYAAVSGARLTPPDASVADYRLLQRRTGTDRVVFVTPSTYGADNGAMREALAAFGDRARGVTVIDEQTDPAELRALHDIGVRGIRFNLSLGAHPPAASLRPMAERIAPQGWHLQLLAPPDTLLALAPVLRDLPVALVFDHFGRIAPADAGRHAAHALVLDLLCEGRAWVKLSGGYIVSPTHRTDDAALDALARSYLQAAPHRVVWGSDWPHATASAGRHPMPDDAVQVDALARWCGDEETLHRVLVDNPAALYGFTPAGPVSLS
ncbi:putative TIM-barrel fold metal-dependent hydrolase [Variovorax boronicumulans]|uniref:amidohydrolase family protein n=1 Tax=Variovorax boronicumulans TaxID=436515 RepID=UPI0027836AD5|nr:amidohydrolase family protein [Variovorax boronicumulans]MDP9993873.1 putative TIM-barrel fold metal-dependent hydrolase [Variovorax boronicumulans]MDQ0005264.1 putative TIM-barrel fold metal-dependent hydrolase [Variovorax boronicumulans]